VLGGQLRLAEAIAIFKHALEYHPGEARLHKQLVNALLRHDGARAVFEHYELARKDARHLNPRPSEVLCCAVLRNESARLPYFLEYYRNKGIGTFLVVDNGSTDGSFEFLLRQPDVYLWQSGLSFQRANFGAGWFEPILRMHGQGHWCLIVDADELLYYPECERRTIPDLCRSLDLKQKRAFRAIHVDMYSDVTIEETHYTSGRPFEEVCPYFDREFFHTSEENAGPFRNQTAYFGGVRQRVFGGGDYYLSKVPLLKYGEDTILAGGQHWTNLPGPQIADETGCLLHFKFFSSFHDYVSQEAGRKEHSGGATQYREYERGLHRQPSLTCYDPAHSIKLENSAQLLRLGMMQRDAAEKAPAAPVFPAIEPVSAGQRPLWSVILSVYRRTGYLEQALRSVLAQAPGPDEMQIEVVSDGPDDPLQDEMEAIVRTAAGGRVAFYRHPDRAGQPEIFNVCVRRARGKYIHLLHDDDWVAPGFYAALQEGFLQAPEAGAAFCRHTMVDQEGRSVRLSLLERETPGIVENWLERIACCCRLQPPSIVVRRDAYERLGGYCPQARSVFDWEMWQRLAVHYPVWFEPRPLAFFRLSDDSESAGLKASGAQIADTRAVIEIARTYLPRAAADTLSRRAGEYYAMFAFDLAQRQIQAGNLRSALLNLGEGIRCSASDQVKQRLLAILSGEVS
jgi:glycosyltransferase involved in cell wall biosynthesis